MLKDSVGDGSSLEEIEAAWIAEAERRREDLRGRSNAKRAVTQFLKSHALGEDRVWQMLCLEYLRGGSTG